MAQPATDRDRAKPAGARPTAGRPADPPDEAADAVMGLDMVLVDAARGPLRRMVPPAGTAVRFGSALARQPGTVARRTGELARELGRITAGSSVTNAERHSRIALDPFSVSDCQLTRPSVAQFSRRTSPKTSRW